VQAKWALKNYTKWKATVDVGELITTASTPAGQAAVGRLCGMKVLRQDDPDHSPDVFETKRSNVGLIVDVSCETPPYVVLSLVHLLLRAPLPIVFAR
jgi:hypothetical protein